MPNSIALANKYLPFLDAIYKKGSLTAGLDAANGQVNFTGANVAYVFKTAIQGLGNYARNAGYVAGDVTSTWEALTLAYDRGRSFQVDAMDNEETLDMAFGTLVGEFMRTRVIPEIDAVRFAKYAMAAGTKVNADLSTSANTLAAIDTAEEVLGDLEVPEDGRLLYVNETIYKLLKGAITRMLKNEGTVSREIEVFDGMEVIKVPKPRFCVNPTITAVGIDLFDGTTSGEEDGGYEFAKTDSYRLNFAIVHPSAVVQTIKHAVPRIFSPVENQTANAWKFDYRVYHGVNVLDNKANGIYVHRAATANSADIVG
jgi:hypothetical protein